MTLKPSLERQCFALTIYHEQSRPCIGGVPSVKDLFHLWLLCNSPNNSFTANRHVDTCPLGTLLRILGLFHKQLQISNDSGYCQPGWLQTKNQNKVKTLTSFHYVGPLN